MSTQFAKSALNMVNSAPIRGADAEMAAAVKQWLRDIAEGRLVVGTPVPEQQTGTPQ